MVFALVPILNSAFYALNSSYYARWFYMPVLILAAMTVSAWEDPSLDLARPARSIAFVMIATLAFALAVIATVYAGKKMPIHAAGKPA